MKVTKEIRTDAKVEDYKGGVEFVSTWLQGTVVATYDMLVSVFGEPDMYPNENIEWYIITPAGIATIYSIGNNDEDFIRTWHIGGTNRSVVPWVMLALEN